MAPTDLDQRLAVLRNILALEHRQQYANRAVYGGLEAYVSNSLLPALGSEGSSQQSSVVRRLAEHLSGYSGLSHEDRRTRVGLALSTLNGGAPAASPPAGMTLKQAPTTSVPPLSASISEMSGVGPRRLPLFQKLGIQTIADAVEYYPKDYHDRSTLRKLSELQYGQHETFIATVRSVSTRKVRMLNVVSAVLADETGTIEATWFTRGYVRSDIQQGMEMIFTGKVGQFQGRLKVESPDYEHLDRALLHSGRIVPIYRLTGDLPGKLLRRVLHDVVTYHAPRAEESLPDWLLDREALISLPEALEEIHFPSSWERLKAARERLSFDEFLELQLGALIKRARRRGSGGGTALPPTHPLVGGFLERLPYKLTSAQQRAIAEITHDLSMPVPMGRMLQGDVGSGKTVVAAAALVHAAAAGYQGALMAPTEILAEQHYRGLQALFERLDDQAPTIALLTGSLNSKAKQRMHERIAAGEVQVVVGTQAVIQSGVDFKDLAVAVVDEQHRFGVEQRTALQAKGASPHLLVMTATPIPRSLALTVYGDLDLSVLDEMPPGRQRIETRVVEPYSRAWAYSFVRDQVEQGRQVFVICPLVEESEKVEARAAVEEYERLHTEVFPDLRLGLLHGRLKAVEKDRVMEAFRCRELDVLVTTSVIEVGIDVPNATVLIVEGADRFGLAQLHQFRGRVGRGAHQSYCLLLADDPGPDGRKRLDIVAGSNDGFYLAEQDLLMRGPGEFYGLRQSGDMNLKVARLGDLGLLERARRTASDLLEQDPELVEHAVLRDRVRRRLESLSEAN